MTVSNNNATCSICGKPYYRCLSCKTQVTLSPWKAYTDTSEHYKIYQIIHGYSIGVYTKDEARDRFKNVDLSDLEELRDNIKSVIKDIITVEKSQPILKTSTETDNDKVEVNKEVNKQEIKVIEKVSSKPFNDKKYKR